MFSTSSSDGGLWGRLSSVASGAAASASAAASEFAEAVAAADWAAEVADLREGLAEEAAAAVAAAGRVSAAVGGAAAAAAEGAGAGADLRAHQPSLRAVGGALAGLAAGASAAIAAVASEISDAAGGGGDGVEGGGGAPPHLPAYGSGGSVRVALVGRAGEPLRKAAPLVHRPPFEQRPAAAAAARFSRLEAELEKVRRDPATFTTDPAGPGEVAAYKAWRVERGRAGKQGGSAQGSDATPSTTTLPPDAAAALAGDAFIAALHARVVTPGIVPSADFWDRYLFRVERVRARHAASAARLLGREAGGQEEEGGDGEGEGWGGGDVEEGEEEGGATPPAAISPAAASTAPAEEGGGTAAAEEWGDDWE
jgi:hypothetical protein